MLTRATVCRLSGKESWLVSLLAPGRLFMVWELEAQHPQAFDPPLYLAAADDGQSSWMDTFPAKEYKFRKCAQTVRTSIGVPER